MTSCARGCCWSPYGCARAKECDCHPPTITEWLGTRADEAPVRLTHSDPTANQALRNITRQQRKGKPR